jgi:predicted PurR-regulated permease PerM
VPQRSSARENAEGDRRLARRSLIATAVAVSVLLMLLFVWYASDLLLLLFAGILVSIPLRRLARLLQSATGLAHGVSLAVVTIGIAALIGLIGVLVAGRVGSQTDELISELRAALQGLGPRLEQYAWARRAIEQLPSLGELLGTRGALSRITGLASTTLGVLLNVLIVAVLGIYLASQSELYSAGLKHLLPFGYRHRAGEVLHVLDDALGRWLAGRLILMVINGGLTALALWMIGVPLAVTLGIIAGVLNFIPNFGPFIAAVPAILIALVEGPLLAVYTAGIYVVVQMVDGYVLTPIVDRKSVELPPVLTLSAQLLLGVLFGFIGLLVASPLTATAMILIKMLYVEDLLGDPIMRSSAIVEQGSARAAGEPQGGLL